MCLKKFVVFTFSNKDAFNRLVRIVEEDYGKYCPEGEVYVIKEYRDWGKKIQDERDKYPYVELMEYLEMFYPPFKTWDDYYFDTWDEWRKIKEIVKDEQDIFGKVTIELQ